MPKSITCLSLIVAKLYPTFCHTMDWSIPGFTASISGGLLKFTFICQLSYLFLCTLFYFCLQFFPAKWSLCIRQPNYWSSGFSNTSLMNVTRLFPLRLTVWISLKSKALSRVFCSTSQFKSINASVLSLLYEPILFLSCIQVYQESGKVVWCSYLSQNFPVSYDPHCQRLYSSQ